MVPTSCSQCGRTLLVEYTVCNGIHPKYYDGDGLRNIHLIVICPDCGNRLLGHETEVGRQF